MRRRSRRPRSTEMRPPPISAGCARALPAQVMRPDPATRIPPQNIAPAMIQRKVPPIVEAAANRNSPTTINGRPIEKATPTCRIGPNPSDWLRFQLCLRGGRRLLIAWRILGRPRDAGLADAARELRDRMQEKPEHGGD